MIRKAAVVVFLAVISAAPVAFAHDGYGEPGYGGHMGWQGDRDDVGLSQ